MAKFTTDAHMHCRIMDKRGSCDVSWNQPAGGDRAALAFLLGSSHVSCIYVQAMLRTPKIYLEK